MPAFDKTVIFLLFRGFFNILWSRFPVMAKRPFMITIVCLLFAIIGLAGLIGGVWNIVDTGVASTDMVSSVIISMVILIVIYGLWKGIKAFWYIGMILAVIDFIIQAYSMISAGSISTAIVPAVVDIIVIWYLSRSKVRSYFKI